MHMNICKSINSCFSYFQVSVNLWTEKKSKQSMVIIPPSSLSHCAFGRGKKT